MELIYVGTKRNARNVAGRKGEIRTDGNSSFGRRKKADGELGKYFNSLCEELEVADHIALVCGDILGRIANLTFKKLWASQKDLNFRKIFQFNERLFSKT